MIILEDKIYKIETLKTRLINKITFKLLRTSGSTNIYYMNIALVVVWYLDLDGWAIISHIARVFHEKRG